MLTYWQPALSVLPSLEVGEIMVLPLRGTKSASRNLPGCAMGEENPGKLTPTDQLWGKEK